jgi:hypothetical protein
VSSLEEQIQRAIGTLGRYANEYQARRHANAVKLLIITKQYGRTRLTYEGWDWVGRDTRGYSLRIELNLNRW